MTDTELELAHELLRSDLVRAETNLAIARGLVTGFEVDIQRIHELLGDPLLRAVPER
jgi:hypothetical protein